MRISDWRSDVCSSDLQISDYLLTGAVTNALNMPSVLAEDAPKLKPYMKLAEQLGSFVGQLAEANLTQVVTDDEGHDIGSSSSRERVCQYGEIWVVAVYYTKKN